MATATQNLTYRCPHCNTPMEVDPRLAEEMLTCPNAECSKPFRAEVPVAIPVPERSMPANVAEAEAAPSAAATHEADLQIVELAMIRRYPLRILAYALVTSAAVAGLIFSLIQGWIWLTIVSLAVLGIAAYRMIGWWLRIQNTTFRITSRRCILENGIFSKETVEVPRDDVIDLRVSQSLWGRLVNVGDILIQAKSGTEQKRMIQVMAVPDPEGVARLIRDQ